MVTSSTPLRSGNSGDVWEKGARIGYAVSGVLHIMLGYLIAKIGFSGGGEADQSQALSSLGDSPGGAVMLWIAVVAFVALGTWQLADALRGGRDAKDRVKAAGKAVVYLALAFTAGSIVMGSGGSDGDQQAQSLTAKLLSAPAGRVLLGAVALGILVTAVFHVWKGAKKKFLEDLKSLPGHGASTGVVGLGMTGYIAKGIALGAVGVLFAYATITADPDKAEGLDGAVESLLGLPGGPVIVVLVGVGFAAYGLYSIVRARHARM